MVLNMEQADTRVEPRSEYSEAFPTEVDFLISAIEAGYRPRIDRQRWPRMIHRVVAVLKLFSDGETRPSRTLYTRQASLKALGFVTSEHLPLSHGGMLRLADPSGQPVAIACTILRCGEAAPGWYEGAVYFNRDQSIFHQSFPRLAAVRN